MAACTRHQEAAEAAGIPRRAVAAAARTRHREEAVVVEERNLHQEEVAAAEERNLHQEEEAVVVA